MLRPAYEPRVLYSIVLPLLYATNLEGASEELKGGIVVGAFAPFTAEVGIWQKLIGRPVNTVYFHCSTADVQAITPPSQFRNTWTTSNAEPWKELIQPDRPERAFASILSQGIAEMLVVGAPTEEIWEEFESRIP